MYSVLCVYYVDERMDMGWITLKHEGGGDDEGRSGLHLHYTLTLPFFTFTLAYLTLFSLSLSLMASENDRSHPSCQLSPAWLKERKEGPPPSPLLWALWGGYP